MNVSKTNESDVLVSLLRNYLLSDAYPVPKDEIKIIIDYIEQQESDARIGRLVQQGIKKVLPHTGCKGEYHCLGCWEILKTNYHGCVLQYYCPTRKEGIK